MAPRPTSSRAPSNSLSSAPSLAHLLAAGPFPAALRAAIQASGLGLDRIQYRLRANGTPISLATLSCWQSGRHQPERASSLKALAGLETILGVRPGALTALVGSPRPRGRRIPDRLLELADIYRDREPILQALNQFTLDWTDSLTRISQHDRLRIGRDRRVRAVRTQAVMRATIDGPDRIVAVYATDTANAITIRAVRGCAVGKVFADHDAGLSIAELLFNRRLRRGDPVVVEHTVAFSTPFPPDTSWERRIGKPISAYTVEIEFTRPQLPLRCIQFASPTTDPTDESQQTIPLDDLGRACAVAVDLVPCRFGVRWEWTAHS